MTKEKSAKLIRILTVPPVMVTALLLILFFGKTDPFKEIRDIVIMIVLLGLFPVLAYPIQRIVPKLRSVGRNSQRKLAFIMSIIGYTAAFVWAILCDTDKEILLICSTYFLSVVILAVCNVSGFKASGHACSVTGTIVLLLYFMGIKAIFPAVIVASAIVWSSLVLKRHTVPQLIGGFAVCVVAFGLSIGIRCLV